MFTSSSGLLWILVYFLELKVQGKEERARGRLNEERERGGGGWRQFDKQKETGTEIDTDTGKQIDRQRGRQT